MSANTLTRAEVERLLASVRPEILALGVRRLALFGSVGRSAANSASDIDILVEFRPGAKNYGDFLTLAELLEGVLGCPVELVTLESLSPFLKPHILAEATDVVRAA